MVIYNTMTRRKEELVPQEPGKVGIYVCGPTVYDYIHIGNARPLIVFDTLRRYLEYRGYEVRFVQNFTDIDDKIIKRANAEGTDIKAVSERFIQEYYTDADALNVKRASVNPKATEHVEDIIELVQALVDEGHAYPVDNGDVYFSVRSYPGYGKLSGQNVEDLESGARIDPSDIKRDPLDFALWKGAKEGEPAWQSPWGMGRPGWHIECSAMSMKILGKTFDIHAGGQDLIFPHHENEIAQSEACTGVPFAKYWMHNGYINIDNQKMSKSLGNFLTVRDISKQFDLSVVRMFMLSCHYRNPVNFSRELVEQAGTALERIRTCAERLQEAPLRKNKLQPEDQAFLAELEGYNARFAEALDDDLNTADAIGVMFDMVRACNSYVTSPSPKSAIDKASALLDTFAQVLGLKLERPAEEVPDDVAALLNDRQEARKAKDFARADELREALKQRGYAILDTANGPKLKKL